jgi:hypothetical protein
MNWRPEDWILVSVAPLLFAKSKKKKSGPSGRLLRLKTLRNQV